MFVRQRITKSSSYDQDNFISNAYCRWVLPFYKLCLKSQNVEIEDLYKCSDEDEAQVVVKELEKNWKFEETKKKPNFCKAFAKTFGRSLLIPLILFCLEDCVMKTAQPILLGLIVRYFSEGNNDIFKISLVALAISLSSLLSISLHHPAFSASNRTSMRAKCAWNTLIYKKCLKLSSSSMANTTAGHIINLMTNDSKRFDEFAIVSSYLLIVPIQTIIFLVIAWRYLGSASLATFIGLMLFIPLMSWIGTKVTKIRSKISLLTDYRICLTNDIIRGIRVIKLFGWEDYFQNILHKARHQEIIQIKLASMINALTLSVSFISARLVLFLSIITYVLMGGKLNSETIFVTIALFERLRYSMTWMMPQAVSGAAELLISCKRIQEFLSLKEIQSKDNLKFQMNTNSNFGQISVNELNSKFESFDEKSQKSSEFQLNDISFDVKSGEILAVVGPVGSGKTSLLLSILREVDQLTAKHIKINGSVAYVSQKPFCLNGTIRENILFGRPFDQNFYNKILKMCALEEDLKNLIAGDMTQIGERGTALSGGQKARINLARSLYLNSDIYLLDDPLSSVDASVAKYIFENCILDFLGNKCVVLVTNQMQFLKKSSKILCLTDGRCLSMGTFEELLNSGIDFMSILNESENQLNDNNESKSKLKEEKKCFNKINFNKNLVKGFNIEDEDLNCTQIEMKTYFNYFNSSCGSLLMIFTLLVTVLTQTLYHLTDYWLTLWDTNGSDSSNTLESNYKNIIIYSLLSCGLFILAALRSTTFFEICLRSSHSLHNKVFDSLLRTSISIIDFLPIGRILNRFTRDIGTLDETIPTKLFDLNLAVIQVIGLLVVVITSNYYFIIPVLIFALILIQMRKFYVKPLQVIRKYESMSRSPIYSHISATIEGLITIRALKIKDKFKQQFYAFQNDHNSCWFQLYNTARLFGIVIDWTGIVFINLIIILTIIYRSETSDRSAGLVFSSILGLTSLVQWAIKRTVDVEIWLTSILRLNQYLNLPQEVLDTEEECAHKKKFFQIPNDWPKSGQITIRNLSMTYPNNSEPVLKNISLKILSGQKIGIVGRTGSGKSSFISALFRLVKSEGNITIDGINIRNIGLRDLRKKISIIPQETTVFSSSIRSNLDPFDEYSDQDLWTALEEVQLRNLVESLPNQLKTIISEQTLNLSVGQRQLICLCRAILRRNRILILDEATANVDHQTDSLIQKALKNKFNDCTVIIVAHRIETVIDCDRILVMDSGRIVDDNSPFLLLEQKNSYFSQLVRQMGQSMSSHLHKSAQKSFFDKKSNNLVDSKAETILKQRNI